MTTYNISRPEPFVIGNNPQQKIMNFTCKVILNKDSSIVYETIDFTPQFAQQSCIIWCMNNPGKDNQNADTTPVGPDVAPSS